MITDAELVAKIRRIADELYAHDQPRAADLLRLADEVEEEFIKQEQQVLPLGSLAEHRRSVTEEARRLLDEPQAEARYRDGIGHADWEG